MDAGKEYQANRESRRRLRRVAGPLTLVLTLVFAASHEHVRGGQPRLHEEVRRVRHHHRHHLLPVRPHLSLVRVYELLRLHWRHGCSPFCVSSKDVEKRCVRCGAKE